jgi:DNA repair protein SbcC/Rad50
VKLIQLRLENFRQHKDSVIDFADGMTAIVGANGTGKSTIVEAISYALYAEGRNTSDSIRFYWTDAKRFGVTLRFEFDGRTYVVKRTSSDASLADVTEDPEVVRATGRSEVKRACEKLLRLNYDQFVNSFCAEQKGLAFLNFRTAAARQDEVARMLGFDRLRQAEDLARQRRSELRAVADALERALGDPASLEEQRKEAARRLKEVEAELTELERQVQQATVEVGPARKGSEQAERWLELDLEMRELAGRAGGLREAVKAAEAAIGECRKEVEEKAALEATEKLYQTAEKGVRECETQRELDRKREALEGDRTRLQEELEDLRKQVGQLVLPDLARIEADHRQAEEAVRIADVGVKQAEERWLKARADVQAELAAAGQRLERAVADVVHAEAMLAKGECPECGQPLKEDYEASVSCRRSEREALQIEVDGLMERGRALAETPASVVEAHAARAAAQSDLKASDERRRAATAQQAQGDALAHQVVQCEQRRVAVEKQLDATPKTYDAARHRTLQAKLEEIKDKHERYLALSGADLRLSQSRKTLATAEADYSEAKGRYRILETERKDLPFEGETLARQAVTHFEVLQQRVSGLEKQRSSCRQQRDAEQRSLQEIQLRLEEHRERGQQLREARTQESLHETAAKELKALRESLNRTVRPELQSRASENLGLLTHARYAVLELDDQFRATVLDDGVRKQVISGGEEDVVALSLRLALSELIQERQGRPMSLLVLDEVFGSLDADRRQSVLDRLVALKERFSQILVISHIEEINQVADRCIYLRRDDESRATVVGDAPPEGLGLFI